jgi:hypothetical protein
MGWCKISKREGDIHQVNLSKVLLLVVVSNMAETSEVGIKSREDFPYEAI